MSRWPISSTCRMKSSRAWQALNAELVAAEARRSEQVPNPDSMDLYFQGMACFHRALSPDALRQGQKLTKRLWIKTLSRRWLG
jgi:hypothetical protein